MVCELLISLQSVRFVVVYALLLMSFVFMLLEMPDVADLDKPCNEYNESILFLLKGKIHQVNRN